MAALGCAVGTGRGALSGGLSSLGHGTHGRWQGRESTQMADAAGRALVPDAPSHEIVFSAAGVEYAPAFGRAPCAPAEQAAGEHECTGGTLGARRGWLKARQPVRSRVLQDRATGRRSVVITAALGTVKGLSKRAGTGKARAAATASALKVAESTGCRGIGESMSAEQILACEGQGTAALVEAHDCRGVEVAIVSGAAMVIDVGAVPACNEPTSRRFALKFLCAEQAALFARLARARAPPSHRVPPPPEPPAARTPPLRAAIVAALADESFAAFADSVWAEWLALQHELADELAVAAALA